MYLEKERHQTLDNFLSASFSKLTRIFKISFEVRVYFVTLKKFYSTYSRKKQLFNLSFTLAASVNYPHVDPLWTHRSHTEDIKQISKLIELCLSILLSALCCIQPQTQQKKKKKIKTATQPISSGSFLPQKALPITSVLSLTIQHKFFCCFMAWCRFFSYWAFYTASLAVTLVLFWVITVWKGRHLNWLDLQKRSEGGEFYISARNSYLLCSSTFPVTPPSPQITPNSIARD